MKFHHRPHTGFTLIELLIVVAIIGILAAIAIPNFLQAQTRAKVARAESDMRAISIALEQYHIDNGFYPGDWYPTVNCWGGTVSQGWDINYTLRGLTSPIAYLSEMPAEDPFGDGVTPTSAGTYIYVNDADQPYYADGCGSGNTSRGKFISKNFIPGFPAPRFIWLMKSQGPDRSYEWWAGPPAEMVYEPSNGTVSNGEIFRVGP